MMTRTIAGMQLLLYRMFKTRGLSQCMMCQSTVLYLPLVIMVNGQNTVENSLERETENSPEEETEISPEEEMEISPENETEISPETEKSPGKEIQNSPGKENQDLPEVELIWRLS